MNKGAILRDQILAHALCDLDIRADKNRARVESVVLRRKELSANNQRAAQLFSVSAEKIVEILPLRGRCDATLWPRLAASLRFAQPGCLPYCRRVAIAGNDDLGVLRQGVRAILEMPRQARVQARGLPY
jgi:hypothetical protein